MATPLLSDLTTLDTEELVEFLRARFPDARAAVLGGSHLYGMAEPSSDLDLWVFRVAPAEAFLGLAEPDLVFTGSETYGGRRLDLRAIDLKPVCRALLDSSFYEIEHLCSPHVVFGREWIEGLRAVARSIATRKVYYGILRRASTELRFSMAETHRNVRQRLFALRDLLAGVHYLATGGQVQSDLLRLNEAHLRAAYLPDALAFVVGRRPGTPPWSSVLSADIETVTGRLDEAFHESTLPDRVDAAASLDALLRRARLATIAPPTRPD